MRIKSAPAPPPTTPEEEEGGEKEEEEGEEEEEEGEEEEEEEEEGEVGSAAARMRRSNRSKRHQQQQQQLRDGKVLEGRREERRTWRRTAPPRVRPQYCNRTARLLGSRSVEQGVIMWFSLRAFFFSPRFRKRNSQTEDYVCGEILLVNTQPVQKPHQ